jgi:hypothetical protein
MADETTDEKLEQYPNTILEFETTPGVRVDLRRPVDRKAVRALARVGLDREFAVLTAENPHGEHAEDVGSGGEARAQNARNERRTGVLVRELTRRGVRFVFVDGVSPDGSYREHCVAVPMPRNEAVALARQFSQVAIFWYDGGRFWLLPAEVDEAPRPLPDNSA